MKIECIIGGVELSLKEVEDIYKNGLYIVTYGGVWQVNYSVAQRKYYGHMVVKEKGIASHGRYSVCSGWFYALCWIIGGILCLFFGIKY